MNNKLKYILSCFSSIYKINFEDLSINYGIDNKSRIQIRKGNIEYFSKREDLDLTNIIWKEWNNTSIPFLFDSKDDDIFQYDNDQIIINFDIIASSFYFLSNWQEFTNKDRDNIGRFLYSESIQNKLNIIEIPVVNYYFDILKNAIEKAYNVSLKVELWNKHEFATFVSHDIDNCQSAWLQGAKSELLNFKFISAAELIFSKIFKEDKWFNFNEILELEKGLGINSTFFFLCRKGRNFGYYNADYNIKNKKFKKVFANIIENGSEIGIHGSFGTHDNLNNFKTDLIKLPSNINGNRFHFLKFDIEKTPQILNDCNIKYDSSLAFAEHFGFRNSFCYPFYLYDIINDKPTHILEIPLILMDGTLQNKRYLKVSKDDVLLRVNGIINEVKKFNGVFSILWHNTHFSEYKYKGWKKIYIELIEMCKKENSGFINGINLYNIFK